MANLIVKDQRGPQMLGMDPFHAACQRLLDAIQAVNMAQLLPTPHRAELARIAAVLRAEMAALLPMLCPPELASPPETVGSTGPPPAWMGEVLPLIRGPQGGPR